MTYYEKNKARLQQRGREYSRERRKNAPEKIRDSKLRAMFGITAEEYDRMFRAQNSVCAICCEPETETRHGKVRRLCVDHDHKTKRVRALLCSACNLALGYLKDNPLIAHAAQLYLEAHV